MNTKSLILGTSLVALGLLVGVAGTSVWAFSKQDDYATRAVAWNKARNSVLLDGLVTAANEENLEAFSSLATMELRLNVLDLDRLLGGDTLTDDEKRVVESTLRGIAHRRERLRLGAYAEERSEFSRRVESVLSEYDLPIQ